MSIRVLASNDGQVLANTIASTDLEISNVTYNGADVAAGTFTDGQTSGIGIDEGVVLTTGNINNATGNDFFSTINGAAGDPALGALIGNSNTNEAASLEFDFESEGGNASFNLVFATEEFTGEDNFYNDVFGLFLNGENIAFVPGTTDPVAVNTVDEILAVSNESSNNFGYSSFTNSFTVELTDLEPGTNSLRLAIADTGDEIADSAIFIAGDVTVENQSVNVVSSPIDGEFVGTEGNDGITGDEGDNSLLGRSGNDAIDGGAGSDILNGGEGIDTAVYQFDPSGVSITLDSDTAINMDGFGDVETLIDIENIIGSEFNDDLNGNDEANSISGRDSLDDIFGNGGDDLLTGGNGSDFLTGGSGSDRFIYLSPNEGGDMITDFEVGIDKITLVANGFGGGLEAGSLPANRFTLGTSATTGQQRIIFDDATGELFFDRNGNRAGGQDLIANLGSDSSFSASDIELL